MGRPFFAIIVAVVLLGISKQQLGVLHWIPLIGAGVALVYFGYEMGYRSGKDRALRDNRNDLSNDRI